MKYLFIILFLLMQTSLFAQDSIRSLESEMQRLKVETALIINSQAIDEYPLWSPNSDYIACNVEGKWIKVRLTNIFLAEAKWREQKIGYLNPSDAISELSSEEKEEFEKVSIFNPRKVITKDSTIVELKTNGMAVSLIVTKKGEKPKVFWTSGGENCHSLVLSPDERFVAYLCELNGLLIMRL